MMNRFAPVQPIGLIRKAILIAVATIVLMLVWASIAISDGGKTYYEIDPDGMMRPDGTIVQYGQPPPVAKGQPPVRVQSFAYKSTRQADGSYLITRNGAKWMTVAAKPGYFAITDPNGTGQLLIKLDQSRQSSVPTRETR